MKKIELLCFIGIIIISIICVAHIAVMDRPIIDVQVSTKIITQKETAKQTTNIILANRNNDFMGDDVGYNDFTRNLCILLDVPYFLIDGIIWNESRWTDTAYNYNTNGSHDIGLFQLNSYCITDILEKIGVSLNPYLPYENLEIGVRYVSYIYHYWKEKGYEGSILTTLVLSTYSFPTYTMNGYINWTYVSSVRKKIGWEL